MITPVSVSAIIAMTMFLVSGCSSPSLRMESSEFQKRTSAREEVLLRTSGEAGQEFAGCLLIDGDRREVSGVSPAEFPLTACVIVGQLRKLSGDGTLSFEVKRANGTAGFGSLDRPGSFCRFGYHDGGVEVRTR